MRASIDPRWLGLCLSVGTGLGVVIGSVFRVLFPFSGSDGVALGLALGVGLGSALGLLVGILVPMRSARTPGVCAKCGYPTEGLTSEVCPECGAALHETHTDPGS